MYMYIKIIERVTWSSNYLKLNG